MSSILQIQTPRLLLRTLSSQDTLKLLGMVSNPSIYKTVSIIPSDAISQFVSHWIERSIMGVSSQQEWIFGIELNRNGLIGNVALHRTLTHNEAELGYWLDPCVQGHGYMTEACKVMINWAFTQLDLSSIIATCALDNIASETILLKLGMCHIGYKDVITADQSQRPSKLFRVEKNHSASSENNP